MERLLEELKNLKAFNHQLKLQINEHVRAINRLSIIESAIIYAREESKSEKQALKKAQ